jgi:hypothetical protein
MLCIPIGLLAQSSISTIKPVLASKSRLKGMSNMVTFTQSSDSISLYANKSKNPRQRIIAYLHKVNLKKQKEQGWLKLNDGSLI